MRKRLKAVWAAIAVCVGLGAVGIWYCSFVNRTIYRESTAHLRELYHQASQSLLCQVDRNFSAMHLWTSYLSGAADDRQMEAFAARAKEETGATDFYFISREGGYRTADGAGGYLDMKKELPELIVEGKDIVANVVVPGQPQIMVFAVPTAPGSYQGFAYEAIAISFNNADFVKTLEISAFDGQSASFVVRPDGRVVVDGASDGSRKNYNVLAMLREESNLDAQTIDAIGEDFRSGRPGAAVFEAGGTAYYLVYESADFEDWVTLGIVPTAVVNASMSRLQSTTLILVMVIAAGILLTLLSLTARKNRRKLRKKDMELDFQDALFTTLSYNVDDIFMMLDAQKLRVDYLSPNVEKLVGIPLEKARADIRTVDALVKNREIPLVFDQLLTIQPGQQLDWDREYLHAKTGEARWFHGLALCQEFYGCKKYILVLSDRTKDRKIHQALENAVSAAQSASKAKSTFLSNMSHDIRTPMNSIIGFTTLALANAGSEEKVRQYLTKIQTSGNYLLGLINDVLDMSRIESGKLQIEEQETNLAQMFLALKDIISGQIDEKQLHLRMDILNVMDEDVYCDKTRLNQVLMNLLSNAIKFTPSGGTITVRLSQLPGAPVGEGRYEIRVKDTGIGMTEEFAAHIFEPFEREQTASVSRTQGTGLGMAISANIIEMMGGDISVSSRKHQGTEFVIRLSLRLQSVSAGSEKIRQLVGLRALVADDDFGTCDSVTRMLTKLGMRSEWTLSGREALLRAQQAMELHEPYRVYILSGMLRDGKGIELIRQLRELGDDTSIVIFAADDWQEAEVEARAAGVSGFCEKPVFLSGLRESLLTALSRQKNSPEEPRQPVDSTMMFRGKRLLLAEDNPLNREIAMEILGDYGFIIDSAENGTAVLRKVSNAAPGTYDLILMDIQMPMMDGFEATRRIRRLSEPALAHIPIIAMTANAFNEDRRAAARCGMNGFLSKPIDTEELEKTLHQIFG